MKTKFIPLLILLLTTFVSCKLENEKATDNNVENVDANKKSTGSGLKITFNAVVEKDDSFQIFFNEDGSEAFTGEQMVDIKIKGNKAPQDIEFLLPDEAYPLNLRFDIGSNKDLKEVKFNSFKVDYKGKSFGAEGGKFFKYFYPNEQVVCDTINSIAKTVGKEGKDYDPIIGGTLHLRNELQKFYK